MIQKKTQGGCVLLIASWDHFLSAFCGALFFENELIVASWVRNKKSFQEGINSVQVAELFFCQSLSEVTSSCSFLHVSSMRTGHFVCLLLNSSLATDKVCKSGDGFFSPRLAEANIVSSQPPVSSHVNGSKTK